MSMTPNADVDPEVRMSAADGIRNAFDNQVRIIPMLHVGKP